MNMFRGLLLCATVAAAILAGAGCASSPEPTGAPVGVTDPGLDIETWFLAESPLNASGKRVPLEAAVGPYLDLPTPLVTGSREIGDINGVRIVSVPTEMLADIRSRVPLAGPILRRGTAEIPEWSPLVVGPRFDGQVRLRLDSGPLLLSEAGRLRLLSRVWLAAVPVEAPADRADTAGDQLKPAKPDAAMYVELVPQYVPDRPGTRAPTPLEAAPSLDAVAAADEGTPFPRLKMAMLLRPGETVILMLGHSSGGAERPADLIGPMLPADSTIGDALFTDRLVVPSRGVQTAVVLTARGPAEFRLAR